MKTSHFFWGFFFLAFGVLLLLANFTNIDFTWESAWKFWPMVLVLIGISILIKNQVGKNIIGGMAGIILALTLYASISATTNIFSDNLNFVIDGDSDVKYDTSYFYEDYSEAIKTATINFKGGAGSFKLITPSDKLAEFRTEGFNGNYKMSRTDNDSHSDIDFNMKKTKLKFGNKDYKNSIEMSLNDKPEWDLNFDVGAASLDLDLTPYKVNKIDVDMGAAALNIKFGDKSDITTLKINAGASDIDILIPDSVGCEINSNATLSSKKYQGFLKINNDKYRTENFDIVKKKIYIDLDCGVSSIDVRKY